jgi:hypothetical protein
MPYHYLYYFHKFEYLSFPDIGQAFVVNIDPDGEPTLVIKKIIISAFPERQIEFTNKKEPNLVVQRSSYRPSGALPHLKASPYIILYGEPSTPPPTLKYRKYGLPLMELVSHAPKRPEQIHLPFIVWGDTVIRNRKYANANRTKNIAYISSNCVPAREKLFGLLKKKIGSGVDALGKCSSSSKPLFRRLIEKIWPKVVLDDSIPLDSTFKVPPRWSGIMWKALPEFYSYYTFGFAMENTQEPGYITEKITNVFKGGAIPIYWGDTKTVEEYFNPAAFINVGKFNSLDDAANYIADLIKDPQRIKKMQQEPIFKNNIMPDMLKTGMEDENDANPIIEKIAKTLRTRYFEFLKANL